MREIPVKAGLSSAKTGNEKRERRNGKLRQLIDKLELIAIEKSLVTEL